MMRRSILFIVLVSFCNCVNEVNISLDNPSDNILVLSGILESNQDNDVLRLTYAAPVNVPQVSIPELATATFNSGDQDTSITDINESGYLVVPPQFPLPGDSFIISVVLQDGSNIVCADVAPIPAIIRNPILDRDGTLNRDGQSIDRISFDISDPPNTRNYYEVFLFFWTPRMAAGEGSLSFLIDLFNPNVFLANEGDQEFLPTSMFFSDELFDGQSIRFEQYLEPNSRSGRTGTQGSYGATEQGLYLLVRSVNESYFSYLKSWTRHRYSRTIGQGLTNFGDVTFEEVQDILFAPQPFPLISNVDGALGTVGAVHTQIVKVQ